jgi:hypothetical protein
MLASFVILSGLLVSTIQHVDSSRPAAFSSKHRNCVYQIFHDDVLMRTLFLDESKSLSYILEVVGALHNLKTPVNSSAVIPCGSEVRLSMKPPSVNVVPMSGGNLLCAGQLIDLNLASEADLLAVRGIGPTLARRILERRKSLGCFSSIEDLQAIRGIGPKKYSAIAQFVQVSSSPTESPASRRQTRHESP